MSQYFDVLIVGAGPAGLFTAFELVESYRGLKVAIVDKGKDSRNRYCPAIDGKCVNCRICHMISGGGGAGLFSDGKLVMDLDVGGHLGFLPAGEKHFLLDHIERIFSKFSVKKLNSFSPMIAKGLQDALKKHGFFLKTYRVIHIGSNDLRLIVERFTEYLRAKGVKFLFNTEVKNMQIGSNLKIATEKQKKKQTIHAKHVVFAVGKEGSKWVRQYIENVGGRFRKNNCYIGVRMEVPTEILEPLFKTSRDPKICKRFKDGSKIKTHCFCKDGQILLLKYFGLPLVGGHTPYVNNKKFKKSNFAILLSDTRNNRYSWGDIVNYMKEVKIRAGGLLLVQRLGDFIKNKSTTPKGLENTVEPSNPYNVKPGNISSIKLPLDFKEKFISFLESLNKCVPGIMDENNLVYAPAVEWWMDKIQLDEKNMNLNIGNIYAIGDGAGLTQGIVQSAATGVLVARDIRERKG